MEKARQHVEAATRSRLQKMSRELIRDLRQAAISKYGLEEFEMAQVGNLRPESVEEARVLVPSLVGRVEEGELQKLVDEVLVLCRFQG